jgi:hypothetical protein
VVKCVLIMVPCFIENFPRGLGILENYLCMTRQIIFVASMLVQNVLKVDLVLSESLSDVIMKRILGQESPVVVCSVLEFSDFLCEKECDSCIGAVSSGYLFCVEISVIRLMKRKYD